LLLVKIRGVPLALKKMISRRRPTAREKRRFWMNAYSTTSSDAAQPFTHTWDWQLLPKEPDHRSKAHDRYKLPQLDLYYDS
jgi:hypothetical protein